MSATLQVRFLDERVVEYVVPAAAATPAELVEQAEIGKPPRITSVLVGDVLRQGTGSALVVDAQDLSGTVRLVEVLDEDDPDVIPVLTYAEAAARCRPAKAKPGQPAAVRMRQPVLAERITDRLHREWVALGWAA